MRKIFLAAGLVLVVAAGLWAGLALGDDPTEETSSPSLPFTIERVSVASDGAQGDSASIWALISADGRYVAFASWATNLGAGGTPTSRWTCSSTTGRWA